MKSETVKQLPLSMWLRESASFANYYAAANHQAVANLRHAAGADNERFVFLWGAEATGKTHLLQAACNAASARGEGSVYLPLREAAQFAPEILEGLEQMAVVAIDDIDAVAGQRPWETALFDLYNRIRDNGRGSLLLASRYPLAELGLALPDLQSRLAWGLVYQLQPMSDEEKLQAMQQRADSRGFELPDEVAAYLLRHYQRQSTALFQLLERLDQRSLAEQRRLTIPFVKQVIESQE
jgi:DnaA family protein